VSIPPPPGPLPLLTIVPKIKAAALTGAVFAVGSLLVLYATGGLTLKAGILAVTGPLLPVVGGYLKSS
jgi:hypothetical protein